MKKQYTSLGLMSGTSGDGVDASIIQSDGKDKVLFLKDKYYNYDDSLFTKFHNLKKKINTKKDLIKNINEIKKLENEITIFHAKVIKDMVLSHKFDLIGFHGQTLYHNPEEKMSMQLGNGDLLSQLSKKKVIFNFRKKDILNGGEGAPLSPIYHKYLIKSKKISLPACILNIGGIANITLINGYNDQDISSKDLGPGNCLLDNWMQANTNNKIDNDGKISKSGDVNGIILEQALETYASNSEKKIIKSYDTKDFDISFVRGLSIADGAATLLAFTAKIIASEISSILREFNNKKISIYVCGGGRKNSNLIHNIKINSNKNLFFSDIDTLGLMGDFIESQAFAYLAVRSIQSLPLSFPKTTGCKTPSYGGEIIEY
tara:strand:- start:787 stop:1908 length:1122 start_codon:yes stop_codon:yes gene_type:complete